MYSKPVIDELIERIQSLSGVADKTKISDSIVREFSLTKDRSVYYCSDFAIRFCKANKINFSNTVLSLSALQKYDDRPFIVCLVTPNKNYLLLSNTTFLKKISHSSHELRVDNIKGSFNGSDIMREFSDIQNIPEKFPILFDIHQNFTFEENLIRLVESTNNIAPKGEKFIPTISQIGTIRNSIERAKLFLDSREYQDLRDDLNDRVSKVASEIAIAAFIPNVNIRGRLIEYLITSSPNDNLKIAIINGLRDAKYAILSKLHTKDDLGDYEKIYENFNTKTDIKTKILFLSSNPKAYNIDKLLKFLSEKKSVYLIFIVGVSERKSVHTELFSIFNQQILTHTSILNHWAGRNSRGVTQFNGDALRDILDHFDKSIDIEDAQHYLDTLLSR